MHENFTTCNKYIPSSTKNINLGFYQDIRLQNGVSMEMLSFYQDIRLQNGVSMEMLISQS
jgi:hypothetical protein